MDKLILEHVGLSLWYVPFTGHLKLPLLVIQNVSKRETGYCCKKERLHYFTVTCLYDVKIKIAGAINDFTCCHEKFISLCLMPIIL